MANDSILYEVRDGCALITLNRPDKLNSFNVEMHRALAAALDGAAHDPAVRAIVLTGAGRGFCAGQDLGDRVFDPDNMPDLGETLDTLYNPLIRKLRALEMPVICAVNGVAAGAGANLAMACDIVLAARSAKFIQAFCKLGLVPDSGGTYWLPRLVGEARAKGLTLLGDAVPAEQAEAWGMIWRAVDDDRLLDEAMETGTRLAAGPTRGLALIKKAIQASGGNSLDAQLDLERDSQRAAGRTDDYSEGVMAFMEKRKPTFRGR